MDILKGDKMQGLTQNDLYLFQETLISVAKEFDTTYDKNEPYFMGDEVYLCISHEKRSCEELLSSYISHLRTCQTEEEFWGKKNIYFISSSNELLLKKLVFEYKLADMSLYINDNDLYLKAVAQWRLKIGK
jgi:hypothetical protein